MSPNLPLQLLLISTIILLNFRFDAYNKLPYGYRMNHYTKLGEKNQSIHHIIKQCYYHSIYYIVLLFCQKLILIKFKILKKKKNTSSQLSLTVIVKFPDFSLIFLFLSNSLIFPHREFFFIIFPVFPVFQSPWPPCNCAKWNICALFYRVLPCQPLVQFIFCRVH